MKGAEKAFRALCGTVSCAAWPALHLYYLCRAHTDGKYAGSRRSRMGLDLPGPFAAGTVRLWVHALSVGEALSSVPLVREFRKRLPGNEIVFSTATETGMAIARDRLSAEVDSFFYMPHDFPWAADALVRRVRPSAFVLIETDAWPNLIHSLKGQKVVCCLANGRVSPKSFRMYSRFCIFTRMLFEGFDLVFTQTEQDKVRFRSLGVPAQRVEAVGNLKFESARETVSEDRARSIREGIGIDPARRVWVAGSTHEGEEEIVLRAHRDLSEQFPELLLIIAPRQIGRRPEIEALCRRFGLQYAVRSKGEGASGKPVYLLDTLGELAGVYSVCDAAFLGGSLVPFGGHNPLEAVAYGKPACWGPHFFNFHEIEASLLENGFCSRVSSTEDLAAFIGKCLKTTGCGIDPADGAGVSPPQMGAAVKIASALLERVAQG